MFMTPRKSLAPWVLLIKLESYFPIYEKSDEQDRENYRPISLLKLKLQNLYYNSYESNFKKIDTIIGEN